jgi:hypothetical protein
VEALYVWLNRIPFEHNTTWNSLLVAVIERSAKVMVSLRKWAGHHGILSGALAGAVCSLVLGVLDAPLAIFLAVPFIAGLVAGSVGNGAKAGVLALFLSILVLVPTSVMLPHQSVDLPGDVSGVGIVGGTLAALTNSLLGSARATMGGFAALFSQLGQILMVLVLVSMVVAVGVGLVASAIAGAFGGVVGRPLRRLTSR